MKSNQQIIWQYLSFTLLLLISLQSSHAYDQPALVSAWTYHGNAICASSESIIAQSFEDSARGQYMAYYSSDFCDYSIEPSSDWGGDAGAIIGACEFFNPRIFYESGKKRYEQTLTVALGDQPCTAYTTDPALTITRYRKYSCPDDTFTMHVTRRPLTAVCSNSTPDLPPNLPKPIEFDENLGTCSKDSPGTQQLNPIHIATGNKYQTETDYVASGASPLRLTRYYNSHDVYHTTLGYNWRHNYHRFLRVIDSVTVLMAQAQGKRYRFNLISNQWQSDADVTSQLISTTNGWAYHLDNGSVENYDNAGRLISIIDRNKQVQTLTYNSVGQLVQVNDPLGRSLNFSYTTENRLQSFTAPDDKTTSYDYDSAGNLFRVTYPNGTVRKYVYEDTRFPHALIGIIDENNNRYATWSYDNQGRAISSAHANGAEQGTLTYNADGTTTLTDALGDVRTYHFTTLHGAKKVVQVDGGPCSSCGGQNSAMSYDANGFLASETNFNNVTTTYINNARGLETSRTEAVGTPQERTIITEWHAAYRLPSKITAPGKVTIFNYDANGNLLSRQEQIAP